MSNKEFPVGYKYLDNLTVVGHLKSKSGSYCILHCNVCSTDQELWPDGSIRCILGSMRKGIIPCGCSKHPTYSNSQNIIIANRLFVNSKYKFVKFKDKISATSKMIITCDICSLDTEMFPLGSITINKYYFSIGRIPCACGVKYCWSEEQNTIRVKRKCDELGLYFMGWEGEYNKIFTKVRIMCKNTKKERTIQDISSFMYLNEKPIFYDDILKEEFYPKQGSTVKPLYKENDYVYVVCSLCHKDEELFPQPLRTTSTQLRSGKMPCQCGTFRCWTDREYRIRLGRLESFKVIIPTNTILHAKSIVGVVCKEYGHVTHKSVDSLFNAKSGCCKCNTSEYFGYYPKRKHDIDHLYVLNFNNDYLKVGRSFRPDKRYVELERTSGCSNIINMHLFTGQHEEVYTVEQEIHALLTEQGYYHHDSTWTVESFNLEAEPLIIKALEDSSLINTRRIYEHKS